MFILFWNLFACTPASAVLGTQDVRVDHTGTEKNDDVEALGPRTCVNDDGKVFVVWQDDRDGTDAIWFNLSADAGLSFLSNDTMLSHGKVGASAPAIACSGDHVYVVWEDKRDGELGYENIYLQWSDDAGRHWQDEDIALDNDPDGTAVSKGPQVAADGDEAWVVWFDQINGAYDIFATATDNGGKDWIEEPVRVDQDDAGGAYSAWPQVVGNKNGNVVVAWEDRRDGKSDIYVNASTDGGESFGNEEQRLDAGDDAGSAESFFPQLAMSGENVYVVWYDERYGENADILANRSQSSGQTWKGEAFRIERDAEGIADSINPSVFADGNNVWVAYQDDRAVGYDIYLQWSTDAGDSWTETETRIERDDNGQAQSTQPVIAVSGNTWLVAWQDFRNDGGAVGFNDLYYNFSVDEGASWQSGDIRINSNEPGTAYAVDAAVTLFDGNVVSVWADGRYGTSDVFAANRPLGEASEWVAPEEDEAAAGNE